MGFNLGNLAGGSGVSSWLGGMGAEEQGYRNASEDLYGYYNTARGDLAPYRDFGSEYGLNALKGYGKFQAPTMEDVYNSPTFDLGKRAVENSAAARGGLMSGNFLRSLQDYSGSLYNQEYARKQSEYQNELAKLMGYTNLGYGAAGGSAGLASSFGNAMAGLKVGEGTAKTNRYQYMTDILANLAGQGGLGG